MSLKSIVIIIETNRDDQAWIRSEVLVHEGRVVQIERREEVRFDEAGTNHHRTDRPSGGSVPAKAEERNE